MRKVFAAVTLIALGLLAQACGGSEKCPAYGQMEVEKAEKV